MTKSRVYDELYISIYVVQLTLTASMYIYIYVYTFPTVRQYNYVIYPIYYIILMQVHSPGQSDDVCHV